MRKKKPLYKKREIPIDPTNRRVDKVPEGSVYGEWTTKSKGKKVDYLVCECSCGTIREVHVYSLTSGKSESCGCKRRQKREESIEARSA